MHNNSPVRYVHRCMDGWTHAWMDADMEAGKQVGKQQVCKQVNTRYSGTLEFKQRWADQSKGGYAGHVYSSMNMVLSSYQRDDTLAPVRTVPELTDRQTADAQLTQM